MNKLYDHEVKDLINAFKIIDQLTDAMRYTDRYNNALWETWITLYNEIIEQTGEKYVYKYITNME